MIGKGNGNEVGGKYVREYFCITFIIFGVFNFV
jgi:hypothetical protein